MAPEQIEGKPRRKSDQYALAVVVYEWLAGVRPFQGTVPEMISQHLHLPPPSLLDQVPTLLAAVEQACQVAQPEAKPGLEPVSESVVPGSETTEANQSQQPTAMAT